MTFESLNNVVKEWSNNTLELGSTVMYPHSKFVDFNFDGIDPVDIENIKEDFENKPNMHFNIMKAEYYHKVPTKIVGATLLFKNKPQFDIEGAGWGTYVDVETVLKGCEFEDYQLHQNEVFNQFVNRLKKLKKASE